MSGGIQLNFTLRTSSKCKTVHLVGSWDSYKSNLPLNGDSKKSGGWKGTFRFTAPTLLPGQRYWYYYIIDGYHVSHDPNHPHVTEPTTGRKLNILDIPPSSTGAAPPSSHHNMTPSSRASRSGMASGRSLSPSQIQHPHPSRPYETQNFRGGSKFSAAEMEALSRRYAAQRLAESSDSSDSDSSDDDSDASLPSIPSLSSRSSHNSSPSSVSSSSSGGGSPVMGSTARFMGGMALGRSSGGSGCSCERYAVTKAGMRVRLDCGGKVCGSGSESGSDSSSDDEEERRRRRSSHKGKKSSSGSSGSKGRKGVKVRR